MKELTKPVSNFDSICCSIGLHVDPKIALICRFLESRGLRFCVDFGTENAIDKAMQIPSDREIQ